MISRCAIPAVICAAAFAHATVEATEPLAPDVAMVELNAREVTLGDIALVPDGETAADWSKQASWVVARIPNGQAELSLSPARQAQLARRRIPGQALSLRHSGKVRFRLREENIRSDATHGTPCFALATAVLRGALLSRQDVMETGCDTAASTSDLAFDRIAGTLRAKADLPAETPLGKVALPATRFVPSGAAMHLVFREGPVAVSRDVETLQPGRPGRRVFVRAEDGETFAAPLAVVGETE